MRRSDGTSRYNNRLDGISRVLDVPADAVEDESLLRSIYVSLLEKIVCAAHVNLLAGEYHRSDPKHILTHEPSGPDLIDGTKSLRPEVAVIIRSPALPGHAEGLAGEPCGEDVDASPPLREVCCLDVIVFSRLWEPISQHLAAELVYVAVEQVFPSQPRRGYLGSSDAAEQRCVRQHLALKSK